MPRIETHAPGSFCWIELATTDQPAAKRFYTSVFGWEVQDSPMGPDELYSMFTLDGRPAAAAYPLRAQERAQGVPPHWMLYVAVTSADEAVARAAALGGRTFGPAFDVMDYGRMAVLQDPAGAVFSVWQAKTHLGTGITGVAGTLCWADLSTPDRDRIEPFYTGLFGWTFGKEDEDPAHAYWHIRNGHDFIGGIPPASRRDPRTPPHWLAYFLVHDCDASAASATALGARTWLPPTTFEDVGRMAVIADPQGAMFALFQPAGRA